MPSPVCARCQATILAGPAPAFGSDVIHGHVQLLNGGSTLVWKQLVEVIVPRNLVSSVRRASWTTWRRTPSLPGAWAQRRHLPPVRSNPDS